MIERRVHEDCRAFTHDKNQTKNVKRYEKLLYSKKREQNLRKYINIRNKKQKEVMVLRGKRHLIADDTSKYEEFCKLDEQIELKNQEIFGVQSVINRLRVM